MIAATVLPLVASDGDPQKAVVLASMLALMVGAIMVLASVAKLGFIADLISKPTMIGYMNGLAITILVGQLPKLFGFSVSGEGFIGDLVGFVQGVANGETVVAAAAVGIAGIVLILALQRWLPKVPSVLVMVVLAIAATSLFGLADRGVSLVGELPQGFPPFTIPYLEFSDLALMFAGALGIALVSLTDTISTASSFAARSGAGDPRQPGNDRHRCREPGRGPVPGLPGEHQRLPDRRGGTFRLEDPAHGRDGCRADPPDAGAAAGAVPEPAAAGAGGHRDHRVNLPRRHPGHGAALAPAQDRVQPLASRPSSG